VHLPDGLSSYARWLFLLGTNFSVRRLGEVRDLCHLRVRYFRVRRIAEKPLPSFDAVRGLGDVGTNADA
jgi:hypothetical protein